MHTRDCLSDLRTKNYDMRSVCVACVSTIHFIKKKLLHFRCDCSRASGGSVFFPRHIKCACCQSALSLFLNFYLIKVMNFKLKINRPQCVLWWWSTTLMLMKSDQTLEIFLVRSPACSHSKIVIFYVSAIIYALDAAFA
jgi:hypothetical protein